MHSEQIIFTVGKRSIDDDCKDYIQGKLYHPTNPKDILLIFFCGVTGDHKDYLKHFIEPLAEQYPIGIAELRKRGLCDAKQSPDDMHFIHSELVSRVQAKTVMYLGHSMGANLAVASQNKYSANIAGFYAIAPYPSIGDIFTKSVDPNKKSPLQKTVEWIYDYHLIPQKYKGVFAYPLRKSSLTVPIRFAIAEQDEVVRTEHPAVRDRFIHYFKHNPCYPNGKPLIFEGKNHCFNGTRKKFKPFNEDSPHNLLDNIIDFIEQLSG
ncbi:hypothetical protein HZA96_06470 [Candidatus Woesearchaeota archaeon]|nr:hypothetical protein [Candidatus Woesearchaeota archaeon]